MSPIHRILYTDPVTGISYPSYPTLTQGLTLNNFFAGPSAVGATVAVACYDAILTTLQGYVLVQRIRE